MIEHMIDFLRARVSEDADLAYDAIEGGGNWYVGTNPDYGFEEGVWDDAEPINDIACMRDYRTAESIVWVRGRFIARQSPNRVHSDATAKLFLILQYEQAVQHGIDDVAAHLFAVLRFFARSYSDHPDFLPEFAN